MQTASRYPWGKGTIRWVRDDTANDSDKVFTVPVGKIWKMLYLAASIATTGDAGNRSLRVDFRDAAVNLIAACDQTASYTANQIDTLEIGFGNGIPGTAAKPTCGGFAVNQGDQQVMPEIYLNAGFSIRVWDINAIQPAADDMTVEVHYIEYDA